MSKFVQLVTRPAGTTDQNLAAVSGSLVTLCDTNTAQTLTNKTFTAPTATNATITTPTMTYSVASLAAAGGNIATAAAIVTAAPALIFATGANAAVGIQLPTAAAGKRFTVKNDQTANAALLVYPQVNSSINGLAANTSISMAANTCADFTAYNATIWFTTPLLPS